MFRNLFSLAKKRLRYFRIRKYESIYLNPMLLINFIFLSVSFGCLGFFYHSVFGDEVQQVFYFSLSFFSLFLCCLLPLRLSLLMLFSIPCFVFFYLLFLSYVARFSFLFIWS